MRAYLSIIAPLLLLSACNKDGTIDPTVVDEKCGESVNWKREGLVPRYTSIERDTIRVFHFEANDEPEDICSEEHITPHFKVTCTEGTRLPAGVKVKASAQVPLRQPVEETMEYDDITTGDYSASINMGLKQAYAGKPGYINMKILAEFRTRGDFATDSAYFMGLVEHMSIHLDYKKHKP